MNDREITSSLYEITRRLKRLGVLSEDEEIYVESYRPGSRRLYRLDLRTKSSGAITPITGFMYYSELRAALQVLVWAARFIQAHL